MEEKDQVKIRVQFYEVSNLMQTYMDIYPCPSTDHYQIVIKFAIISISYDLYMYLKRRGLSTE